MTGREFLADARRRGGWDEAAWQRLLRHGGMHLERRRLDAERLPDVVPVGTHVVAYSFRCEPEPLVFDASAILLDDAGVVAVDKLPFFTVQGSRASRFSSLERALQVHLACPGLVPINRLDRETSGVVLFARDGEAASFVGRQLIAGTLRKEYLAVVSPPPARREWTVEGSMARVMHPSHSLFQLAAEGADGKYSLTRFEVVEARGQRALVRCRPQTGRTHQLRVHLAAGATPIVGDSLYGAGHDPARGHDAERLLLHSASVTLRLARGEPEREIRAPVPEELRRGLEA
jgi:RluA family pseudouridine synthase